MEFYSISQSDSDLGPGVLPWQLSVREKKAAALALAHGPSPSQEDRVPDHPHRTGLDSGARKENGPALPAVDKKHLSPSPPFPVTQAYGSCLEPPLFSFLPECVSNASHAGS